jgi:hypothetical protein
MVFSNSHMFPLNFYNDFVLRNQSGFTDAQVNFLRIIDRYYVRLRGQSIREMCILDIYQLQNDHERIRYVD